MNPSMLPVLCRRGALLGAILLVLPLVWDVHGDWPQRRGPLNDGVSSETAWVHAWPTEGPRRLWRTDVGVGFSSVAVADGRLYTQGNTNDQETVVCLDPLTGESRWRFTYAEPLNPKMYEGGPNSTPTVSGSQVFVTSRSGKAFALDAATGSLIWSNNLMKVVGEKNGDWGIGGSPLVSGDRVFINHGAAIVALDRATGRALWKSAIESKGRYSFTTPVLSRPAPSPDGVLYAHMHKSLFALSPADGRVLWRHGFGRGFETHAADPVLTPFGVFISSGDDGGELLRVEAGKAERLWKTNHLGTFTGTAVLVGEYLYGVHAAGYVKGSQELRCVAAKDGKVMWSQPGFGQDSLIVAGDRLIVLTEKGELVVARAVPDRGEILARAQVLGGKCWTQPCLANGLLYCRNARGELICLDLRESKG